MAQVINTNSLSLMTQNNLNKSQSALGTAIERLSSGLRINSAKDDAAGQAISNRFTSNITGLTQASRNANDGISVAQTTEGSLSEINNNLQRIRELSVQAANGTNSSSDLDSIQDEITSRLSEIDRVSGQTQFNGVKVLAKDSTMSIQVGSNDGETIKIDLQAITADTLGLNGFNVNGKGITTNKAATVSDLTSAGATLNAATKNYDLVTTHDSLTSDKAFAKLSDGDKVSVGTDNYTYNAKGDNFSITKTVLTAAATTAVGTALKADAGTTDKGSYTTSTGTVNFDTDSAGKITIGGAAAYIDAAGNLTTNNAGTTTTATMGNLFTAADTGAAGASLSFKGTSYTFAAAANSGVSYNDTATKDTVLTAAKAAAASSITYNSGVMNSTVTFATGTSANTYVDGNGEITKTASYTTSYGVNADTGAVTVAGYASATDPNKQYAQTTGATVNLNTSGKLTTDVTSTGTATKDPLAALDAAISKVDQFRSSLGAVQNRFDSAITNLNNTTTNLQSAQSRIQDADYATEVSAMSKAQILQQAGTSVLSKANQVPQSVLSLLQ
ncbi:FliC/FljB family flagellin [Rahnella inusitata]|uniref:FliC/FljB family flagellin n=1 Tax=Rahnella inusitata TaxID=58169 RepID=UPI0039BEB731